MFFAIIGLAVGSIVLIIYALLPAGQPEARKKGRASRILSPELDSQRQRISTLQEQTESLKDELEALRLKYLNAQQEFETAKKQNADLKEQLDKREEWTKKNEEFLNREKQKGFESSERSKQKEKELLETFSKNVDLNRGLKERQDRLKLSDDENKKKSIEIQNLKAAIEGLTEEVHRHKGDAAELKRKQEASGWISKKDFDKLNDEYTELEKELELLEKQLQAANEERIQLKMKLTNRDWLDKETAKKQEPPVVVEEEKVGKEQSTGGETRAQTKEQPIEAKEVEAEPKEEKKTIMV